MAFVDPNKNSSEPATEAQREAIENVAMTAQFFPTDMEMLRRALSDGKISQGVAENILSKAENSPKDHIGLMLKTLLKKDDVELSPTELAPPKEDDEDVIELTELAPPEDENDVIELTELAPPEDENDVIEPDKRASNNISLTKRTASIEAISTLNGPQEVGNEFAALSQQEQERIVENITIYRLDINNTFQGSIIRTEGLGTAYILPNPALTDTTSLEYAAKHILTEAGFHEDNKQAIISTDLNTALESATVDALDMLKQTAPSATDHAQTLGDPEDPYHPSNKENILGVISMDKIIKAFGSLKARGEMAHKNIRNFVRADIKDLKEKTKRVQHIGKATFEKVQKIVKATESKRTSQPLFKKGAGNDTVKKTLLFVPATVANAWTGCFGAIKSAGSYTVRVPNNLVTTIKNKIQAHKGKRSKAKQEKGTKKTTKNKRPRKILAFIAGVAVGGVTRAALTSFVAAGAATTDPNWVSVAATAAFVGAAAGGVTRTIQTAFNKEERQRLGKLWFVSSFARGAMWGGVGGAAFSSAMDALECAKDIPWVGTVIQMGQAKALAAINLIADTEAAQKVIEVSAAGYDLARHNVVSDAIVDKTASVVRGVHNFFDHGITDMFKTDVKLASQPDAPVAPQPDAPVASQPDAPAAPQPDAPVAPQPDAPVASQPDAPAAPQPDAPAAPQPDAPARTTPPTPPAPSSGILKFQSSLISDEITKKIAVAANSPEELFDICKAESHKFLTGKTYDPQKTKAAFEIIQHAIKTAEAQGILPESDITLRKLYAESGFLKSKDLMGTGVDKAGAIEDLKKAGSEVMHDLKKRLFDYWGLDSDGHKPSAVRPNRAEKVANLFRTRNNLAA